MGGRLRAWILPLLAGLLIPLAAAAPSSDLQGVAGGVGEISAPIQIGSLAGALFYHSALGNVTAEGAATSLRGSEYYSENLLVAGNEAPGEGEKSRASTMDGTSLRLAPRGPDANLIVVPTGAFHAELASTGAMEATGSGYLLSPRLAPGGGQQVQGARLFHVADPRLRFTADGLEALTGEVELRLWDFEITIEKADGTRQTFLAGEETVAGPGGTTMLVKRYFVLRGSVSALSFTGPVEVWADAMDVTIPSGTLSLAEFSGDINHGGAHPAAGAAVTVTGSGLALGLDAPAAFGGSSSVALSGTFDAVTINGAPVNAPADAGGADVALAATAGIGILATLALVGGWIVHHFFFPLFPGFIRQSASEFGGQQVISALRNPTRRRILKLVQERPGIQPYHVWKEVGGALGVTMRGLALLEELHLVRSLKIGRNKHYYENNALFDERQAHLTALLYTPTVGQAFRAVYRLGSATQKQIAEQLGLAVSTVSERLAQLLRLGLLQSGREGGLIVYRPAALQIPRGMLDEPPAVPSSAMPALV